LKWPSGTTKTTSGTKYKIFGGRPVVCVGRLPSRPILLLAGSGTDIPL